VRCGARCRNERRGSSAVGGVGRLFFHPSQIFVIINAKTITITPAIQKRRDPWAGPLQSPEISMQIPSQAPHTTTLVPAMTLLPRKYLDIIRAVSLVYSKPKLMIPPLDVSKFNDILRSHLENFDGVSLLSRLCRQSAVADTSPNAQQHTLA
jgi:hypothetical protein